MTNNELMKITEIHNDVLRKKLLVLWCELRHSDRVDMGVYYKACSKAMLEWRDSTLSLWEAELIRRGGASND